VDHYIVSHEYERARELLDAWPDVNREFDGYLRAELDNPFFVTSGGSYSEWIEAFNRAYRSNDLAEVHVRDGGGVPFDRLAAPVPDVVSTGHKVWMGEGADPKVSVIMTTYNPGRDELLTSVESMLEQTLSNIEVIVVDDASDPEHEGAIAAVEDIDPRVRVIHAPSNGGTYRARNIGLQAARGEFVTGQDDDDWSHPQRLERQVRLLEERPDIIGCRISSFTCLPNLCRVRLGYKPLSANASSLMLRRATYLQAGGFVEARKAADTELHRRVERMTGKPVVDIDAPLALVRIEPESLSRSEFRAGWSHPARREFKFSYAHWHGNTSVAELALGTERAPVIQVPRRFRVDSGDFPVRFDVVFAGDWRQYGGPQKSMIEEIRALTAQGLEVGVLQLEAPRFMTKIMKPLTPHIQSLINAGVVTEVLYDDPVDVDLLILRYPPILQFGLWEHSELNIRKMLILANQAPSELDGSDIRYLVPDCTDNARSTFCEDVTWVPQGPQVRQAIAPYLESDLLAAFDMPGILDPAEWYAPRKHRRGTLPVVGRHSRDNAMKWPEDAAVIEQAYPTSGRFDVRVLGGATVPGAVLGRTSLPAAWTVYATDALPVPTFLRTLDFYVFFQNSVAVEAFGRSILEAIASRMVVILPRQYEEVFGEAALYAEPKDVQSLVMSYHNDRKLYSKQVARADAVVEQRFSHRSYAELIKALKEEVTA
jgi:hypothetical protein